MGKYIFLIIIVIVSGALLVLVHILLERFYFFYARKFCLKNGYSISRYSVAPWCDDGIKTEYSIVNLDCLNDKNERKIVNLLAWVFGIHKVLSIDDYKGDIEDIHLFNSGLTNQSTRPATVTPIASGQSARRLKIKDYRSYNRLEMTNSVEYDYNPSWKLIFLCLFVSIIPPIAISSTPSYIISALFLLGAFSMVIRLIFLKRNIILTDKNITVPSGLFSMFPKTCELNDIIEFSEKRYWPGPWGYDLRRISLTTETNKYEIVLLFMKPDEYYELSDKIENTLLEIKGKPLNS